MDLNNLLKLAGLAAQRPEAEIEVEENVPGEANTRPDPQIFPDGPSNLGSVSDTSLRRYLKAKGQHVTVDETVYPDYSVEEVLESYVAYTAEKAKNPYAIGMAAAMKSTGDNPPLKKSTINKAHKIAKGVDESSMDDEEAGPVLQQLRKEVWSAIREIQTGAAAGKDMTDDILDELGDYYDDVQASGDPDLIKAYTEVRLDAPDQPPRVQAKIALLAMNAIKKKAPVKEGAAKGSMIKDAETMSKADFIKKYGAENADTWKNINETAKPDFLDMDKDGDKKEPMKKALKDKEKVSESISYLKRLAGI